MKLWHRTYIAMVVLVVLRVVIPPPQGWGQNTDRIGTVLIVEGVAEVRARNATEWERLRFRDAIFLDDTVRTSTDSKIKALLRDDSIMTLGEQGEIQFTEFLLTEKQRRTIVSLFVGKIRVITTRLFGTGSVSEVHTPNAVAGIRGSEEHVEYDIVAQKTVVFCATGGGEVEDHCYFLDPADPSRILNIPKDHIVERVRIDPPLPPRLTTIIERQNIIQQTVSAPPQDPTEVQTTEMLEQEAARPVRGVEPGLTQPAEPAAPELIPETPPQTADVIPVSETTATVRPEAITTTPQIEAITPDTSPGTQEFIQKSRANIILNFPR